MTKGNHKWTILATQDTQGEEEQSKKHNTICDGHHFAQANTTDANKT